MRLDFDGFDSDIKVSTCIVVESSKWHIEWRVSLR